MASQVGRVYRVKLLSEPGELSDKEEDSSSFDSSRSTLSPVNSPTGAQSEVMPVSLKYAHDVVVPRSETENAKGKFWPKLFHREKEFQA